MKNKLFIALVAVVFAASSANAGLIGPGKINIGAGFDIPYGVGYQIGYSISVIPLIDLGLEYSSNSISLKDIDTGSGSKTNADFSGTRFGATAKINLILIPLKLHFGSHSGKAAATASFKYPGTDTVISASDASSLSGTYFAAGLDYQFGPIYIEPMIGTQTIKAGSTTLNPGFPSFAAVRAGINF